MKTLTYLYYRYISKRLRIHKPCDLTIEELKQVKALILSGGVVHKRYLLARLKRCKYIARYYVNGRLVGVGAVKTVKDYYKQSISKRYGVKVEDIPDLELGYMSVCSGYRGRGIYTKISNTLYKLIKDQSYFCTTSSNIVRGVIDKRSTNLKQVFKYNQFYLYIYKPY